MGAGSMEYGIQQVWHNPNQSTCYRIDPDPFRYQRSLLVITSRAGTHSRHKSPYQRMKG